MNLRLLKMIFLRGPWLLISALYCFVGIIIDGWGRTWIEESIATGFSAFAVTLSVVPAAVLLYLPVLSAFQNSAVVVKISKEKYFSRLLTLMQGISFGFTIYYGTGVYLLSKFLFTDGIWYDREENLKIIGLKLLMLFLFLVMVFVFFCICMVRNVNMAGALVFVLAAAFGYWLLIGLRGMALTDYTFLCAGTLVLTLAGQWILRRSDLIYWR